MQARTLTYSQEDYDGMFAALPRSSQESSRAYPAGMDTWIQQQVGGKSFVFFRNPRADATDPETGERYADVIVFWVGSESDKQAMV